MGCRPETAIGVGVEHDSRGPGMDLGFQMLETFSYGLADLFCWKLQTRHYEFTPFGFGSSAAINSIGNKV